LEEEQCNEKKKVDDEDAALRPCLRVARDILAASRAELESLLADRCRLSPRSRLMLASDSFSIAVALASLGRRPALRDRDNKDVSSEADVGAEDAEKDEKSVVTARSQGMTLLGQGVARPSSLGVRLFRQYSCSKPLH